MKMLSLIVISMSMVLGCNYRKMTPQEIAARDEAKAREEHANKLNDIKNSIEVFEYNGHSFLLYSKYNPVYGWNGVRVVSMTHNPDCKCLKK